MNKTDTNPCPHGAALTPGDKKLGRMVDVLAGKNQDLKSVSREDQSNKIKFNGEKKYTAFYM